jgi:hypothetical protein
MRHCSENSFCRTLSEGVREKLCAECVLTTLAQGTYTDVNFESCFLVVDGLCALEVTNVFSMIVRPGDFAVTPNSDPNSLGRLAAIDYGYRARDIFRRTKIHAVKASTCAVFRKEPLKRMFENLEFLHAMYENLRNCSGHALCFHTQVYERPAYDAVAHVLRFERAYVIGNLTHAQIAYLTGKSRSTVTEVMHQIALAEPELLENACDEGHDLQSAAGSAETASSGASADSRPLASEDTTPENNS